MKIKFHSKIKHPDNDNVISFVSKVTISKWQDYDVYEFLEPKNNVMNRIEVNETKVNIFAGPASIMLSLNEEIKTPYQTPSGTIVFKTLMTKLEQKDNLINFVYRLNTINDELVGQYDITLEFE